MVCHGLEQGGGISGGEWMGGALGWVGLGGLWVSDWTWRLALCGVFGCTIRIGFANAET